MRLKRYKTNKTAWLLFSVGLFTTSLWARFVIPEGWISPMEYIDRLEQTWSVEQEMWLNHERPMEWTDFNECYKFLALRLIPPALASAGLGWVAQCGLVVLWNSTRRTGLTEPAPAEIADTDRTAAPSFETQA